MNNEYSEVKVYFYVCQSCFWEGTSFPEAEELRTSCCEDCGNDDLRVEEQYV